MTTPRIAYRAYLRAGAQRTAVEPLARATAEIGRTDLAELLTAYRDHGTGRYEPTAGLAAGSQVFIGPQPPDDEPGAFWFDTCDLSLMVCLANDVDPDTLAQLSPEALERRSPTTGWLAMEPVLGWQFGAFCDVASIHRTTTHLPSSFVPLDSDRIDLDGNRPVTSLSILEASLHLAWVGKYFPHQGKWQQARSQLGAAPWSVPAREWAGATAVDDDLHIALTPQNIDIDLDELVHTSPSANTFHSVWDTPNDVTFRGQIEREYGLDTNTVAPRTNVFGLKLESRFPRPVNEPDTRPRR